MCATWTRRLLAQSFHVFVHAYVREYFSAQGFSKPNYYQLHHDIDSREVWQSGFFWICACTSEAWFILEVSFTLPHLLHLSLCSQKFVYTCCCSAVMSLTLTVSVLVADVNELLRTIWQYLCVYDETTALEASWTRLILWLPFLTLSLWLAPEL